MEMNAIVKGYSITGSILTDKEGRVKIGLLRHKCTIMTSNHIAKKIYLYEPKNIFVWTRLKKLLGFGQTKKPGWGSKKNTTTFGLIENLKLWPALSRYRSILGVCLSPRTQVGFGLTDLETGPRCKEIDLPPTTSCQFWDQWLVSLHQLEKNTNHDSFWL